MRNRILDRYIRLVRDRPVTIIAGIALITIAPGAGLPKLGFDTSLDSMIASKDPEFLLNEDDQQTYGTIGKFTIMDAAPESLWSDASLHDYDRLISNIEECRYNDEDRERGRRERFRPAAGCFKTGFFRFLFSSRSE